MSTLLDEAIDSVKRLPVSEQNDIARAILRLAGKTDSATLILSDEEQSAIERSKQAAANGDFASGHEIAKVWAKHGL